MNGCVYRTTDDKCEFYSDHGKGIVSYCDFDDCEEKKPSNADCIRAMTDEELAELLETIPHCRGPAVYTFDGFCIDDGLKTKKSWLDWLKQEVKEDE